VIETKTIPLASASREVVDAYRLQDPVFCGFLEETGRLIVVTPQTQ
jgi:hypothetical protein